MACSYFRLVHIVIFDPGYVPRGPQWRAQRKSRLGGLAELRLKKQNAPSPKETGDMEACNGENADQPVACAAYPRHDIPNVSDAPSTAEAAPGLDDFYSRSVFACQGDGRPIWCSMCLNWKPDRAHHCREVDRCVRKMDHYCPWVAGVISERSFKFFIQFVFWTFIFCVFNLVLMAILVTEVHRATGTANVHWIIALALAGLFALFSLGMTGSSTQFALLNTTTIENLSRKTIVWQFAVHIPDPVHQTPPFPTISFATSKATDSSNSSLVKYPDNAPSSMKTFAILHSKPGENPWDLGALRNFKSVMGDHWYDWLLPIRISPCCNHEREDSQFETGPVLERMRQAAGISKSNERHDVKPRIKDERKRRRRRRRRRHSHSSTQAHLGTVKEKHFDEEKREPVRDVSDMV